MKHRSIEIACGHRTSRWRFGYPLLPSSTASAVQWLRGTVWWLRGTVFPHGASWKVWSTLVVQTIQENGTVTHFPVMALRVCKNLHKLIHIVWFFSQHNNFGLLAIIKLPWEKFYCFHSYSCLRFLFFVIWMQSVPFLGFRYPDSSLWLYLPGDPWHGFCPPHPAALICNRYLSLW